MGSPGWPVSFRNSSTLIRFKIRYFCSAEGTPTGSKRCTGKATGDTAETVTISRAEYEALEEQNAELSQQVQWLMEQMRLAKKRMFGASSEKARAEAEEQLSFLFNEAEAHADIEQHETVKVAEHVRKRASGIQKDNLPEDVPTDVVNHDLPENRRVCPNCDKDGTETAIVKTPKEKAVIPAGPESRQPRFIPEGFPRVSAYGRLSGLRKAGESHAGQLLGSRAAEV